MDVSLCPVTNGNIQAVLGLSVAPDQAGFLPSVAEALALTTVMPGSVVCGIVAGDTLVGLLVHGLEAETGRWWLRHLMVDARYQRRGYGRSALGQLVAQLEPLLNVKRLYAQFTPANLAASLFGTALGFRPTDDSPGGEHVTIVLQLPAKTHRLPQITLREVTLENARACITLAVAPDQARFVASNAASLVQSKFEAHWLTRAIYDGEAMVGFVMYGCDPDFGWGVLRLMVDAAFQGRGYGRTAIQLVLADIQAAGGTAVGVGYEADNHLARQLYHSLGFVETDQQPFGQPFAILTFPAPA